MEKKHIVLLLFIAMFSCSQLSAQVTVGLDEKPVAGALVQLKNIEGITNGDANSDKGLGVPRVSLTDLVKLEPTVETTAANKLSHTGLLVYNVTTNATLKPGIYVWDGDKWARVQLL